MRKNENVEENCFGYALRRLNLDIGGYTDLDEGDIATLFEQSSPEVADVVLFRNSYWLCHMAVIDPEERGFVWQRPFVGGKEEHVQLNTLGGLNKLYFKVYLKVKR